jgi:hypothetical protein
MPVKARYQAQEALVRPLRGQAGLWRLAAALSLVAAVSFSGSALIYGAAGALFPGAWLDGLADGSNPAALLLLLGGFGFVILGVAFAALLLQGRNLWSVTGPPRTAARQFRRVAAALVILAAALMVLPPYGMGPPLEPNLPVMRWLALLPLSLAAVLIQVSAEEILFRGYIQQALAARFRQRWIWLVLPSALFAFGHYLPADAGQNAMLIALWAGLFGVLMADLTARAGTLGPAIAVHFFNNAAALLIAASPTSLNGLALYLVPFEMSDADGLRPWLIVDAVLMLVSWLAARLAIRR